MITCPPHIPRHRIDRAVKKIRAMRRAFNPAAAPCGFPDDLGCETQLYLAVALFDAYPDESAITIAGCCGVDAADAHFFGQLVLAATGSPRPWMHAEIRFAARNMLLGLGAAEPAPQPVTRAIIRSSLATKPKRRRGAPRWDARAGLPPEVRLQ